MLVIQLLSFIQVGILFAAFSIFAKTILKPNSYYEFLQPAEILQYIYLIFLGFVLLISITIELRWAESGFRVCSLFMGLYSIAFVSFAVGYVVEDQTHFEVLIIIGVWLGSLIIPFFVNLNSLKYCEFLKGIL